VRSFAVQHQSSGALMAFEHPTSAGIVRLAKTGHGWAVQFVGKKRGHWRSPDDAANAVAHHMTGLPHWDECREPVSQDIIDWRPLDDSI
jgi:hypothetical protein